MGKLIIDTPDSTFYYCGSCAERVAHNSWECHSNVKNRLHFFNIPVYKINKGISTFFQKTL